MTHAINWFSRQAEKEFANCADNFTIIADRVIHYTGQYVGKINPVSNAGVESLYPK
jgi:hypothetical protein